jgi:hypothetical protein
MDNTEVIKLINEELAIELPETISFAELKEKLSDQINYLIESDFQKLVSLLYRIDVSEAKLKEQLLEAHGIDAGKIIADLIIDRQIQKIRSRQQFKQNDKDIDDAEKW